MRILHLIATLSPSTRGPGEACLGLCRELAKRGHEVSIYTTAFGHSDIQGAGRTEYPLAEPVYDGGVEIRFFAETDRRFYLSSSSLYRALRTVIPNSATLCIYIRSTCFIPRLEHICAVAFTCPMS